MDNWSEGCEQGAGGQGNGLYGCIIFTVDSELDVGRECEDAQGKDLRCCLCRECQNQCGQRCHRTCQILHVVILLLCNEQLLDRHASVSKTSKTENNPSESENVQPG